MVVNTYLYIIEKHTLPEKYDKYKKYIAILISAILAILIGWASFAAIKSELCSATGCSTRHDAVSRAWRIFQYQPHNEAKRRDLEEALSVITWLDRIFGSQTQGDDVTQSAIFSKAIEVGTVDGWNIVLSSNPDEPLMHLAQNEKDKLLGVSDKQQSLLPNCMQKHSYDQALSLGPQGLRNFISECKSEGGDLLHSAYDALDTMLYNTTTTCLQMVPACQAAICADDYITNGISPYVRFGYQSLYSRQIRDINEKAGDSVAKCMTASVSGRGYYPQILMDSSGIDGTQNTSFAGTTIQFEITEDKKNCVGAKCEHIGSLSRRFALYIHEDGKNAIHFGDDLDADDDAGDAAIIGKPYYVLPDIGNWKLQRVIRTDKSNDVLVLENKAWNTSSPIHRQFGEFYFIIKSGEGCYVKHFTAITSSDNNEHTSEIIPVNQTCRLYKGAHKKWAR